MKIVVHAGHNPDGKLGCGAVGILKESTCARNIVSHLCKHLMMLEGVEVVNTTVNDGINQQDVLRRLAAASNTAHPDLELSIHLNASENRLAKGVETWIWPDNAEARVISGEILDNLESIGYANRGVKTSKSLYVLKNTNHTCILIECGFVTNAADASRFNAEKIAIKIVEALATILRLKTEETPGACNRRCECCGRDCECDR